MEEYRCFIGIDLPGDVKRYLAQIQSRISSAWPARVKWVEEPNFHLTLKFLGDVNLPRLEKIETGLEKVSLKHNKCELLIRDLINSFGLQEHS